jgi:signal transduction histidine kinase/ABC-type uncharacterized transport system substrate-binding protein
MSLGVSSAPLAQVVPQGDAERPEPLRVLILYAVAREHPAASAVPHEFRRALRNDIGQPTEYYEEYLDFSRFSGAERHAQLARIHREKYDFRFDVVVAVGSRALNFATDPYLSLFPDIPVVFALAMSHRVNPAALPPNVTGRTSGAPFEPTLALARRLQPGARHLFILAGTARPDSDNVVSALSAVAKSGGRELDVHLVRGLSHAELLDSVGKLPPRSITLYAGFERDSRGVFFNSTDVVGQVAARANAPVYAALSGAIGTGVVGGALVYYDLEGARTADLVLRTLRRDPGDPMPPIEARHHGIQVDWRQLRRWGLSEANLPTGAQVRFRTLTSWERYRTPILLALGIIAVQSLLLAQLLGEHRRRVGAQRAVEEQLVFERLISQLTAELADDGTELDTPVLERALERLGNFMGARSVIIADYARDRIRCVRWQAGGSNGDGPARAVAIPGTTASPFVFPLLAATRRIGTLELQPSPDSRPWSERQGTQMRLAADVIAGAIVRDQAARAARRGEELNRAVLASVSAQIVILDGNGRIVRVNDAWREHARQAGIDGRNEQFVGMSYVDECERGFRRGDPVANEVRHGIESVLAGETWRFCIEYQSATTERWYEMYVDRLDHVGGGAVVTHHDVTDRRRAELLADESRQQIAHMARVLTVGELAATLVHELGQPLTAIGNNAHAGAHIARGPSRFMSELKEIFDDIANDQARATEVVSRVRMMLRKDHPRMEQVDLNEVCRGVRSLLRADAGKRRATIELSVDPAAPTVLADPVQLQQVVINLVVNALEAVSATVGTREVHLDTRIDGDFVVLNVRDNGLGLPHAAGALLFEPFFSTKTHGLGMGLAIVRSFVERHGGTVEAENCPDGGAVFRMVLPLARVRLREAVARPSWPPRATVEAPTEATASTEVAVTV